MPLIEDLNNQHAIESIAEILAGKNNLPAVTIKAPSGTQGTLYLHGAHITSWTPEGPHGGEDLLFLSQKSLWQHDKPIRGGIPICFPWFGPKKDDPTAPIHGFARTRQWTLEKISHTPASVTVSLSLASDDATRKIWPHDFLLRLHVTFANSLTISLELTNTGTSPLTAEEALHTYFQIGDIHKTRIHGLENTAYIDKTDNMKEKTQTADITITSETDRVYLNTTTPTIIEDQAKHRKITITKQNSKNTVIWNPWIAKAKAMPDFGDDEWPHMLCAETCNVAQNAITLPPNHSHTMTAKISVDRA
ncbi:MAG: D-hexose-6-phosphate mutarotase [Phycisphaerae bacterium]